MVGRVPGVAPQAEKREQWAALIRRGVSNSEACRIVGINVRTGKRWRHGRKRTMRDGRTLHYAPVITSRKVEVSERYLSEDEREAIAELRLSCANTDRTARPGCLTRRRCQPRDDYWHGTGSDGRGS